MSCHFDEAVRGEAMPLLRDELTESIYHKMLDRLEKPLLVLVMEECHNNQSLAAVRLGINRATLRTKLKHHGLL